MKWLILSLIILFAVSPILVELALAAVGQRTRAIPFATPFTFALAMLAHALWRVHYWG